MINKRKVAISKELSKIHNYLKKLINYKKKILSVLDFFEILYKSDLGLVFDALTAVNKLGFYNNIIREILGMIQGNGYGYFSERIIYSYIKKISDKGVTPVSKIDYSKIGLDILLIHIDGRILEIEKIPYREWLLSYQPLIRPLGSILVYYVPSSNRYELVKRIREWLINRINIERLNIKIYEYTERLQPYFRGKLSSHLTDNFIKIIYGYTYEELKNILENCEIVSKDIEIPSTNIVSGKRPSDIIDLILLKEFQINAFQTLSEIASKYNMSYRTLRKHLEKHIINYKLIDGVFLPSKLFLTLTNNFDIILLSFKDSKRYLKAVSFFKNIAYTIGLYFATPNIYTISSEIAHNEPYELAVLMYTPIKNDLHIYSFIKNEITEDANVEIYTVSTNNLAKYTIPYTNYDQEIKSWTLNTDESYRLYVRRVLSLYTAS